MWKTTNVEDLPSGKFAIDHHKIIATLSSHDQKVLKQSYSVHAEMKTGSFSQPGLCSIRLECGMDIHCQTIVA